MKTVEDFEIPKKISANQLMRQMEKSGGFTAKSLAIGTNTLERMIKDKDSLNFLSFPACILATGTRGIIRDMVKKKWFGVLVTTCGTLDHDLARCFKNYYHGDFALNDKQLQTRSQQNRQHLGAKRVIWQHH
jgi:deoxyhypusine synthase